MSFPLCKHSQIIEGLDNQGSAVPGGEESGKVPLMLQYYHFTDNMSKLNTGFDFLLRSDHYATQSITSYFSHLFVNVGDYFPFVS